MVAICNDVIFSLNPVTTFIVARQVVTMPMWVISKCNDLLFPAWLARLETVEKRYNPIRFPNNHERMTHHHVPKPLCAS
jgi:hypothetical protein